MKKTDEIAKDDEPKSRTSDDKIIEEAKANWAITEDMMSEQMLLMADDIKFSVGNSDNMYQWPQYSATMRSDRPTITINKTRQFINQVVNDARQNQPQCKVRAVDGGADKDSALIVEGICRNIESTSKSNIAYDTAIEHAAICGMGYFRLRADYLDYDSFNQELIIDRVADPLSVRLDPFFTQADAADARWGFIESTVSKKQFEADYPDADMSQWDSDGDWYGEHGIRVVEYLRLIKTPCTISLLEDGTSTSDEVPLGSNVASTRKSYKCECEWYKLTSAHILERSVIKVSHIPIYPVIGNEVYIDGKAMRTGMIRNAKDAQRNINYLASAEIEMVALSPKAPYIGYAGQFNDPKWKNINNANYPYVEVNPVDINGTQAPLPQRQQFALASSGLIQAKNAANQDLREVVGMYNASLGANSPETSGRAILAKQKEGDTGTYHYIDNLSRAMVRCWRDIIEALPYYYDVRRISRILGEDGSSSDVLIDPEAPQAFSKVKTRQNGKDKIIKVFNPNLGKYDLAITIGATYATQRMEAAESKLELAKVIPQIAQIGADLIVRDFDFRGADELADRIKASLPQGIAKNDEEEDLPPQVQQAIQQVQQTTQMVQEHQQALAQKEQEVNQAEEQLKAESMKLQAERALFEAQKKLALTEIESKQLKFEHNNMQGEVQAKDEQAQSIIQEQAAYIQEAEGMIQQLSDAINQNEDESEAGAQESQETARNDKLDEVMLNLTALLVKMNEPKVKTGIATVGKNGQVELKVIEG